MFKSPISPLPEQVLGTCVLLFSRKKEKILLGKRKNSYKAGQYGLPGGRVNTSEKLIDCAKRELFEETGLKADFLEYLGVIRDFQEGYSFIHFAFLCKEFNGTPKVIELDKCEGWEWFGFNDIPPNTLPGHRAAIDIFLNTGLSTLRDVSSI